MYMKMTFDSENFLSSPRVRCWGSIILFIIAAFLIFHLGMMVGEHKALRHHGYGTMGGWGNAQNAAYYNNPDMDAQYGEAAGYSGDGAMTDQQIYQDSGYPQANSSSGKVFIYRTVTQ
jgi:hypothetical protein